MQKVGKIVGLGILITDLNTKGQQYFNDFAAETVSERERKKKKGEVELALMTVVPTTTTTIIIIIIRILVQSFSGKIFY